MRSLPRACDSRNSLQVVGNRDFVPASEQGMHSVCDRAADFEHEPSFWAESFACLRNEALDHFEARRTSKNCTARLELPHFQLHLFFFRFANIWGVRYDEIELGAGSSGEA